MNDCGSVPPTPPESERLGVDLTVLLPRVLDRDEAAARELVTWLYPILLPVVRGNLPQRDDIEDLMQDIHLKIFSRLDQYRGDVPFEHWVRRLALNTCFDRLRRQKARPEIRWADLSEGEMTVLVDRVDAQSADDTGASDAAAIIERLLGLLPAQEAWLIRALDLEQRSIASVCGETGWNGGVARIRAFRARHRLRKLYQALEAQRP